MKYIFILVLSFGAFAAHATKVVCTSGQETLTYDAERMNFKNSAETMPIIGEIRPEPSDSDFYAVFYYPVSSGRSIRIVWTANSSEIMRSNAPASPVSMKLYGNGGTVTATYSNCRWE